MEHVPTGVIVGEFEDRAFTLAQHHGVGQFVAFEICSGAVEAKEISVHVERVQKVELRHVAEVDAYQLPLLDLDGVPLVVEGHRVYRIDFIVPVEVRVEPVHQHHHFVGFGSSLRRIYDKRTVQTFVHMPLQGDGMAVIEVEPHGRRVELVDKALSRLDYFENAVHVCSVDTVEVDRVWVTSPVGEIHLQPITFGATDARSGNRPVVGPCSEVYSRRNLDLAIQGSDFVLPLNLSVGERRYVAVVEMFQEGGRIESRRIHIALGSGEPGVVRPPSLAARGLVVS